MDDLMFTLNAILPILIPIFLGYLLSRLKFFSGDFLAKCNKFVFTIFIPILLFKNLYKADLSQIQFDFLLFAVLGVFGLFLVGLIVVKFFIPEPKQKGVVLQALFRSNYAIIGIPLAEKLGDLNAPILAAVIAAATVPLFNILAVISLSIYSDDTASKPSVKSILKKIITNPLIIGVACGLLVNFMSMGIDALGGNMNAFYSVASFIPSTINSLAGIATPLMLVILGARFEFKAVSKLWRQLTLSVSLRLFVTPLVMLTLAYLIGFRTNNYFATLIALFATPIAVSSVPMAAQMNADEELAGQIVVWTSFLSMFTLFVIIIICRLIGLL